MNKFINLLIPIVLVTIALFSANASWRLYMDGPWTRDGRILSEVTKIVPQISGRLINIAVVDNQFVKAGQLLFEIDNTDYVIAVANAKAVISQAQSNLAQAQNVAKRNTALPDNLISKEEVESDVLSVDSARGALDQANAALKQAEVNLHRTGIVAPADGFITNLNQRLGNFVTPGQVLVALVESKAFYAIGYFEESKIGTIQPGDRVKVTPLSGSYEMFGHVQSIGRGIVDGSADRSGLLPNVQPTIPWVRLGQRIPIRIKLDAEGGGANNALINGITCTIEIIRDE